MSRYAQFKIKERCDCTHTRRRCASLKKDKKPWYPHGDTVQNSQCFLWKKENAGSSWGVVQSYKRTHNIRLPGPFGFYSNGNNGCNRNELGRQLIVSTWRPLKFGRQRDLGSFRYSYFLYYEDIPEAKTRCNSSHTRRRCDRLKKDKRPSVL